MLACNGTISVFRCSSHVIVIDQWDRRKLTLRQNHQSRAPEMYAFTARWLVLIIITLQNHLPCPYNFELVLDIEVFDYVENHYFLPTPSKDITLFLNYKINKLTQ